MGIQYQIRCFESDIVVRENQGAYRLSISVRSNPLGSGNRIAEYDTEERAVLAAKRFCQLYTIAREYGYHLDGGEFQKTDMPPLPVANILELQLSEAELRALLDQEARIYDMYLSL
jgi:hypothetical protein